MIRTSISAIIVLSLAVALLFYYFANGLSEGLCSNTLYKEYPSPDRSLKAVVFQRECGPSTGATTQVSLIEADKTLENSAGNLLVLKGEPEKVAPEIEWKSRQEMIIYHAIDGHEFKAETHYQWETPITIHYQK
ncbi:MAG: hypothetical protein ABXS91_05020 [Sulfurimonas sp.]